jgi:hypothetical protein
MISSEVQRTLVKSPPELWAEISDPEALARHLGEFGEIRITRVQPEQKVEWEAPEASGSIVIKPSGWGTKVRLTVTRELGEAKTGAEPDQASEPGEGAAIVSAQEPKDPAESAVEVESQVEGESESSDELEAADAEMLGQQLLTERELAEADGLAPAAPLGAHESESGPLPEPAGESELHAEPALEPEPARRLGFFARLFGRRRAARTGADEPDLHTFEIADDEPSNPAPVSDEPSLPDEPSTTPAPEAAIGAEAELEDAGLDAEPTPTPADGPNRMNLPTPAQIVPPTPVADVSEAVDRPSAGGAVEHPSPTDAHAAVAELEQAEEAAEEQVTAVLTGVLDRLGAAHHRPFSRA